MVRDRAAVAPPSQGLWFHEDGAPPVFQSFSAMAARARTIAVALEASGARGERVLLVYPQGLEYIAALYGCFLAGAVAVPVYPPNPARLQRTLPRFLEIVRDARPKVLATTSAIAAFGDALVAQAPDLAGISWFATDALVTDEAAEPSAEPSPSDVALLQYTSGSTAAPKGVVLQHGNMLANLESIRQRLCLSDRSTHVSWLPFYHDLGLVGGVLQPFYTGGTVAYCSPLAFLSRPAIWMEMVTRHRATLTGAPNFAYDLVARKTPDEALDALDLSSLVTLYCGAEPIRRDTLARFFGRFERRGARRAAIAPCYGLAEAVLLVSFQTQGTGATALHVDAAALGRREVVETQESAQGAVTLFGCGPVGLDTEVRVVDPDTRAALPEGRVGELWVRGPGVSSAYFGREELSRDTMHARLDGSSASWLRTGDLGFFARGEVVVAGRIKDLLIIQGRNVYPQDVELAAELAHPAVRGGCCAAFGLVVGDQERVVVVAEVEASTDAPAAIAQAIRRAVVEAQEVTPQTVVLVAPKSIPKTSSGKIQRQAAKQGYLAGELEEVGRVVFAHDRDEAPASGRLDPSLRAALVSSSAPARLALLEAEILARARARLPGGALGLDDGFFDSGLDSSQVAELGAEVELLLGRPLSTSTLFDHPTPRRLAARLALELAPPEPEVDGLDALLDDLEDSDAGERG